ncbi:MAG: hypothetical protein SGILL_008596, partial [Bacillariaceae sp.]
MKLSIAAAVLAQQSLVGAEPADDSSFENFQSSLVHRMRRMQKVWSGSSMVNNERGFARGLAATYHNAVGMDGSTSSSLSSQERDNVFVGILKNLQQLQEIVECDTQDASRLNMDVVGILSCGPGRYCKESSDSPMGGVCAWSHQGGADDSASHRMLQEDESSIIDDLQYACDYAYLIGYDCSCDLDSEQYSGTASCSSPPVCSTYPSACNVNSTDCRSDSYAVNILSAGTWETELCVEFTKPYEQKTCYSTTMMDFGKDVQPECYINFQGEVCSSCAAYPLQEASGNETMLSEICYTFDCSNTAAGSIGNTCDFPVSSMSVYLDTYGCPPCNVCGDNGTMMSPETAVRILNNTYECGYIQDVSMMGFFTEASCQYFSSVVEGPCECHGGGAETQAPSSPTTSAVTTDTNSTFAPTNEPNLATDFPMIDKPESLPPGQICNPCPNGDVVYVDAFVMVPGQSDQVSCAELKKAGMDGSIPTAACGTVQNLAATPCCGKDKEPTEENEFASVCNPCGPDKEMTNVNGVVSIPQQGMLTCN